MSYLKANPGKMTFASSGNGSSDHLTAELFWQQTGTSGVHVPYRGGGPVMTDLLGNQVESSFMNINTAMPQIKAGKLRALAITSEKRSPLLPDVPTLEENGVKNAGVQSWQAVAAPRGLPPDIKKRMHEAIVSIIREPATSARLAELGFEIVLNTPEQFAAFQAGEYARWPSSSRPATSRQTENIHDRTDRPVDACRPGCWPGRHAAQPLGRARALFHAQHRHRDGQRRPHGPG